MREESCKVASLKCFEEKKAYFKRYVDSGIYSEIPVEKPFYTFKNKNQTIQWYATKWYKCNVCGCLWEFDYPDPPAQGFIRKFPTGIYIERGY